MKGYYFLYYYTLYYYILYTIYYYNIENNLSLLFFPNILSLDAFHHKSGSTNPALAFPFLPLLILLLLPSSLFNPRDPSILVMYYFGLILKHLYGQIKISIITCALSKKFGKVKTSGTSIKPGNPQLLTYLLSHCRGLYWLV